MAKRPVAVILLQIVMVLASLILAVVAWRASNITDLTPEQKSAMTESILRMVATIIVFLGTFFALCYRSKHAKLLSLLSLGWLAYSVVIIVTNFGVANKKTALFPLSFADLTYANIGTFLLFLGWAYALLGTRSCQEFFEPHAHTF